MTLRWNQIDLQGRTATLLETKTGGAHTVALSAPAVEILASLPRISGSPFVLPMLTDASRPFSKDTLEGAWQRIREAAGLEDIRLHDLRHTVGTYAGQAGANAFLVRDLLRHKSLAVTGRYVNRDADPVRELSDQVAGRIAAGLAGSEKAEIVTLVNAKRQRQK